MERQVFFARRQTQGEDCSVPFSLITIFYISRDRDVQSSAELPRPNRVKRSTGCCAGRSMHLSPGGAIVFDTHYQLCHGVLSERRGWGRETATLPPPTLVGEASREIAVRTLSCCVAARPALGVGDLTRSRGGSGALRHEPAGACPTVSRAMGRGEGASMLGRSSRHGAGRAGCAHSASSRDRRRVERRAAAETRVARSRSIWCLCRPPMASLGVSDTGRCRARGCSERRESTLRALALVGRRRDEQNTNGYARRVPASRHPSERRAV